MKQARLKATHPKTRETTYFKRITMSVTMTSLSDVLDAKYWENQPYYFFKTLKPNLSHYAQRADDACLQAQIDVFGTMNIGTIAGSLAPPGNFASLVYSESLPDRLPILAYLNEILSFYEGKAIVRQNSFGTI